MSTIRRRRPRVEFAQLPNAALRDYRLSWRARGLLAELLSYPPGYEISVDELVRRARQVSGATEGREAMRTAVRELKSVGYIVSTRRQDERGRWITEVEVTDDPAYELPNPPLEPDVSPDVSPTPNASVSAGRTDDGFPGVGEPGVGAPGVIKNTDTNTEKNILPPTPSGTRASADTPARQEEFVDNAKQLVASALRFWDSSHARPSAPTRRKLVSRVAQELAAGADPDAVLAELVRDLHPSQARSAVRVVMARTREPGWAQDGENPARLMANVRPPWCGTCDEATRHLVEILGDGREQVIRCPYCHPVAVTETPTITETTETPTATPAHQEPQTAAERTQSAEDPPPLEELLADLERPVQARTSARQERAKTRALPPVVAEARARLAELRKKRCQT